MCIRDRMGRELKGKFTMGLKDRSGNTKSITLMGWKRRWLSHMLPTPDPFMWEGMNGVLVEVV